MKITRKSIAQVMECLLGEGCEHPVRKATVYLDEKTVVTATRRFKPNKRNRRVEILLKLGEPNYREREFIAACQKSKEPFPIKRVQIKFWSSK